MAVSYIQSFHKYSYTKSSPGAQVVKKLAYAGQIERRGVNGRRTALVSGGYIYYLPTNYSREQDMYPIVRQRKWYSSGGKLHSYIAYEGPDTLKPNGTSYYRYYTDRAWGKGPGAAAKAKAYNALRSNAVNLAMLTKDLYDATKLAGSYFDRLNKAIPYLLKRKFRKAYQAFTNSHKIPKGMANTWLEFQWGVLPSIEAVQTSFKRAATDPARVIRVTGGGTSEMMDLPKVDGTNVSHDFDGSIVYTARCRAYRYYKNIAALDAHAFNPIEPAWDAIPWSFLVGWFAPIEEWLYQFNLVPSWIEVQGCDSMMNTVEYKVRQIRFCPTRFANGFPRNGSYLITPLNGGRRAVSFTRTKATGLVRPMDLSELIARSHIGLTCKRVISSAALATQRLT